jgi:hypothetical protein
MHEISEWNENWNEWKRKFHIKCTHDDIEVSKKELPKQWL